MLVLIALVLIACGIYTSYTVDHDPVCQAVVTFILIAIFCIGTEIINSITVI